MWTKKMMPLLLVIMLFIGVPAIAGWRWAMFYDYGFGSVCEARRELPAAPSEPVVFDTREPCFDTGIHLKEGRIYRITIKIGDKWKDREFDADPSGLDWSKLGWGDKTKMVALSFTRRFWSEDWFGMMGSIGRAREFAFRIEAEPQSDGIFTYRFQAFRSGTLYLFVNDAIVPGGDYYGNNTGTAQISVETLGEI